MGTGERFRDRPTQEDDSSASSLGRVGFRGFGQPIPAFRQAVRRELQKEAVGRTKIQDIKQVKQTPGE